MTHPRRQIPPQDLQMLFQPGQTTDERKALLQRRREDYDAERQKQIDAQTSPFSTPQERIQLWERLHALTLPLRPQHRLVQVIAAQTELSVADIHAEQQRRAEPAATP